jgi:hypothetical protein
MRSTSDSTKQLLNNTEILVGRIMLNTLGENIQGRRLAKSLSISPSHAELLGSLLAKASSIIFQSTYRRE